ncbi:hypothetical protein [Streptosporangium sp. NPDC004631]
MTGPRTATVGTARTPAGGSWLNRVEARFTALRHFTLDGTGHAGPRGGA